MATIDDDSTRLSAYLDDELHASARASFEAELLDSEPLRNELDSLRAVRQLLRDLPRPTPPRDIALDAVREIERRGLTAPRPLQTRPTGRAPWMVLGSLSAVAASLLLFWLTQVFDFRITIRDRAAPSLLNPVIVAHVDPPRPLPTPPNDTPADLPQAVANDPNALANLAPVPAPPPQLPLELPGDRPDSQSEQLAQLLGAGPARRILITFDTLSHNAMLAVESAIDASPRTEAHHARLHLDSGVGFDPDHPGTAIVYVLTLKGGETEALRRQLEKVLPGQAGPDTDIRPGIVASLFEVRTPIAIHQSIPRSLVQPAPPAGNVLAGDHARESDLQAKRFDPSSSPLDDPMPILPPRTPGDPLNSARIGPVPKPRPVPSPPPVDTTIHTYLLWLTEKPTP